MSWFDRPSQSWTVRWATWFGLGRAPRMPGTFGTFGALPLIFIFTALGQWFYMAAAVIFSYFAIEVADRYEKKYHTHDPKEIVIDEVAGYFVAMAWLPLTWQALLSSFFVFRFLDVVKPFPIGWIDRKARGGIGVVADDLLAGILTNIALQVVYVQTLWLGEQWVR